LTVDEEVALIPPPQAAGAIVTSIEILTEQWPVIFIKIDGEQTIADFEAYIDTFNRFYEKETPFSIVTLVRKYSANPHIVSRVGRWFKDTESLITKHWISNAMVSQSAGFRFVLSAVYLIKPLPIPSRVCATPDEALAFTRASWMSRGLTVAPRWPF
jgi:hypothetical protein